MSDVSVRALGGDDWQVYRDVRLAALREAPDAFAATLDQEAALEEDYWRMRMARSARLLAATEEHPTAGIVSVGDSDDPEVADLFGMWVVPVLRGAGVAWQLTRAATDHARVDGRRALQAWVPVDNGRAVAFFSSYGFRPSDQRRRRSSDLLETALVYPLGDDPFLVPSTQL